MRKFLRGIGLIIVLLVLLYGYLVWKNNASVAIPERAELETTLENAAADIARRESVIIGAAQEPGFNMDRLRKAWGDAAEIL